MIELDLLKNRIRLFADNRNWDQYHSPKNLAMALIVEAAELVEHFQWMTEDESSKIDPDVHKEISQEIADIFVYLIRLSDKLNIDLINSANDKMDLNEKKYPAEKVRGSSKKYTAYMD